MRSVDFTVRDHTFELGASVAVQRALKASPLQVLFSLAATSTLSGCIDVVETATVHPGGEIAASIEARVERRAYDLADPELKRVCRDGSFVRAGVPVEVRGGLRGAVFVCRAEARIPADFDGSIGWLDVVRGRDRIFLAANPAGFWATGPVGAAPIKVGPDRARLAGHSWRVTFSGPALANANTLTGEADWDFPLLDVVSGASISGTLAQAEFRP